MNAADRERIRKILLRHGVHRMTDNELLTLLFAPAIPDSKDRAAAVGQALFARFGSLENLLHARVEDIAAQPGIGYSRARRLKAALELGGRALSASDRGRVRLDRPEVLREIYAPPLRRFAEDRLLAVLADRRLFWSEDLTLATGSLLERRFDPAQLYAPLLHRSPYAVCFIRYRARKAASVGYEEELFAGNLLRTGRSLGILVLDYAVVGSKGFFSLAKNGRLADPWAEDDADMEEDFIPAVCPDPWCIHDTDFPFGEDEMDDGE